MSDDRPRATLYAIPGSHACETGALLLEHKGIPYRRVDLPPGMHSLGVRLRGFPGRGTERKLGDRPPTRLVALGDRLGTVPAVKLGDERLQTNRRIARRLDQLEPEPPLFPADPELRAKVEEAERWGDEEFQMVARRLVLAGGLDGPDGLDDRGGSGRLGPLLWRNERMRIAGSAFIRRQIFAVDHESEREMLDRLPAMLDRIDAWIAEGVLNGAQLNAADFMIASSLALLCYRRDLAPRIEPRPAGALVDRVWAERSGTGGR